MQKTKGICSASWIYRLQKSRAGTKGGFALPNGSQSLIFNGCSSFATSRHSYKESRQRPCLLGRQFNIGMCLDCKVGRSEDGLSTNRDRGLDAVLNGASCRREDVT